MSAGLDFAMLRDVALRRLVLTLPALEAHRGHPATQAMADLIALSQCRMTVRQQPHSVLADLVVVPDGARDGASGLFGHLLHALDGPLRSGGRESFDLGAWLDGQDFAMLIALLVADGAAPVDLAALCVPVTEAICTLDSQVHAMAAIHAKAVLVRDCPALKTHQARLSDLCRWLLAPHAPATSQRAAILARRLQALTLYGAVAQIVMASDISEAIDAGRPLAPLLCERLSLAPAQLRHLQDMRSLEDTVWARSDYRFAIGELAAHEVPLARWPDRAGWAASIWQRTSRRSLLPPDFLGTGTEARDALDGLLVDILCPIAVSCFTQIGGPSSYRTDAFLRTLETPLHLVDAPARRAYLAAMRRAIIGNRGPRRFAEAVQLWHRRAASIAALRHEKSVDQPGWPALCAPWTDGDGHHQIVPLTSAEALVEEGNALGHCVGGYYSICRSGQTQIFSLRRGDERLATLEFLLEGEPGRTFSLRVGQFKSHGNQAPGEEARQVLHRFLEALRAGVHPVAAKPVQAYRRGMAAASDHSSRARLPSLDDARAIFPLHRALLPRGTPSSLDAWAEQSGLIAAITALLPHIRQG